MDSLDSLDSCLLRQRAQSGCEHPRLFSYTIPSCPHAFPDHVGLCSAGGVTLSNAAGSIVCANTLDDRLKIAYTQNLPKIRETLFGLEAPVRA